MDHKDRLILALSALLRAERETREAMEAAISAGVLSRETLTAMASDPIAAVTQEDIELADRFAHPYEPPRRVLKVV